MSLEEVLHSLAIAARGAQISVVPNERIEEKEKT
jgi:hypothetical protein